MSLAILRPRVEALVGAARVMLPLTRERLVPAILAARPGALGGVDVAAATLGELEDLATAAEVEAARRIDTARHLQDAALRYSRHRPHEAVVDLIGTGAWYLRLPAGWVAGFSAVRAVEYPVGERPPARLGRRDWWLYEVPGEGQQLAFYHATPAPGALVRVTTTAPHQLAESTTTLPETAWDVVVKLAAGSACLEIASFYTHERDDSIQVDGVRHGGKGKEFGDRGKAFRAEAEADLPELEAEHTGPAGAEVSFAGEMLFLTH